MQAAGVFAMMESAMTVFPDPLVPVILRSHGSECPPWRTADTLEDTGKGEVMLRQCPTLVDDLIPDSHFLAKGEDESIASTRNRQTRGNGFYRCQPMIRRAVPPGHTVVVNPLGVFDGEGNRGFSEPEVPVRRQCRYGS